MSDQSEMEDGYLTGHLLVSMPSMRDDRFHKAVIYVCNHTPEGAMGLVINKKFDHITFKDLLEQLELEHPDNAPEVQVHFGGPVETGRGFVLHTADFSREETVTVSDTLALTGTVSVLKEIAEGAGPDNCLFALGYAGWGPGQLDQELQNNGWLSLDADMDLIFDDNIDKKWDKAMERIGVDVNKLSIQFGRA